MNTSGHRDDPVAIDDLDGIDRRVYERRWKTLAVLCTQPDDRHRRQHRPQRGPPDARPASSRLDHASCSGWSTPTRSCSPACCSPPAPSATASAARAPCRPACSSSSARLAVRRRSPTPRPGHRRPRRHGRRRGVRHARHAVDPHQRLPARTSGPRPSPSGPASPAAARPSAPSPRGFAARALLVGLGVPRQRARSSPSPSSPARSSCPRRSDPEQQPLDPLGAVLSIVGLERARLRHHRGPQPRLDCSPRPSLPSAARSSRSGCSSLWELQHPAPDARPALLPATGVQRRRPAA